MRRSSIIALALLAAAPAMGQGMTATDDSSLSIEASVHSSVGVSALDDTTTGSIDGSERLSISAANGTELSVLNLDPDGNGLISDEEREAAQRFAASSVNNSGECDGLIVSASNAEQIAAVSAATHIALSMVCADPKGLTSAQRAAIAANSALMDRLATAGYGLGDVAGIVLDADGRGTLYLSAS